MWIARSVGIVIKCVLIRPYSLTLKADTVHTVGRISLPGPPGSGQLPGLKQNGWDPEPGTPSRVAVRAGSRNPEPRNRRPACILRRDGPTGAGTVGAGTGRVCQGPGGPCRTWP